jgi:hypothetical protein
MMARDDVRCAASGETCMLRFGGHCTRDLSFLEAVDRQAATNTKKKLQMSKNSKQSTMDNQPPETSSEPEPKSQRGRKRPYGESLKLAYSSFDFSPRESTGRPRSPHRFFSSSYKATFSEPDASKPIDENTRAEENKEEKHTVAPISTSVEQVVHHHINGLCIVTAGESLPSSSVRSIQFVANEAPACSAAVKRKRQGKMMKGGKVADSVNPSTVIAQLELENGETIPLYACVWGTILELNHSLTPEVLADDPLLDGYLAVILPSGRFPPKKDGSKDADDLDDDGEKDSATIQD